MASKGPLLITWMNIDPNMDKQTPTHYIVEWNYWTILRLKCCTDNVSEWKGNIIIQFTIDVITYPCRD